MHLALASAILLAGCQALSTQPEPASTAAAGAEPHLPLASIAPARSVPPRTADPGPPAATPTPVASPSAAPPSPEGVVPILYYHRVQAAPADFATWPKVAQQRFLAYHTLPPAFTRQLDWLKSHGYTTVLPRDLAAHWDHGAPLPPRPVVLTFDDGFPSWVSVVLPALRSRGMVAEFHLTLDAVRVGAISWAQVRSLASAGNGIGAHDVHHVQLAGIPGQPDASRQRMWAEVWGARREITAQVGVPPDSMAYVGGGFDAELVRQVRRAGYTTARSVERGVRQDASRRYLLRVVRVAATDDVLDVSTGAIDATLPVFAARMRGATGRVRPPGKPPPSPAPVPANGFGAP